MTATTQSGLLDVVLIVSSGEAFATKKISFLFKGNMKQLKSYIYNICQLWSLCLITIVSVYDVDSGKYICKFGGLE